MKKKTIKKGRHVKPSPKRWPIILPLCLVAVIVLCLLLIKRCNEPSNSGGAETQTQQSVPAPKNPDSIAIPGYEALELKADTLQQTLCLPNPAQNMCYLCIELYLEDGTLLWRSELIEPGKTSKPIVLTQALAKGNYTNAVLRYSCFKMDGSLAPLNGAETKLTLWVK